MHRMLKLALGGALAVAMAAPAFAQDQFPDVPDNHWAYEALRNLKDRVLFGYPDKLYRGSRPMSRYEFAVAVNQLWQLLSGRMNGLEDQIKSLEQLIKGGDTGDMQNLRDQLVALNTRVDTLEKGAADLQKLVKEFESELQALGVNVDELKRNVSDLDARVRKLEANKPTVVIGGDVNLLALAGYSDSNHFGITQTGRIVGVGRGSYAGDKVGVTRDLNVLHDAAVSLKSTNETGPKFKATFVLGNLFSGIGSTSGPGIVGTGFTDTVNDIYVHELVATFDSALVGQSFSAMVGRFGYQISPYLFKRSDYTPFYANERWDNGDYSIDGGALSFNFGTGKLTVFGGRNNTKTFNGADVDPIGFGGAMIDRTFGADLSIPLGQNLDLRAAYLIHDSDTLVATPGGPANRVSVYGGELKGKIGDVKVGAAYSKTPISENGSNRVDKANSAWDVNIGYENAKFGLTGGYREIERNFSAAGDWGRLGMFFNPTDVRGWNVKGHFQLSDDLKLSAKGEFLEGKDGTFLSLDRKDDITSFNIGLDYRVSDYVNLMLNYEDTKFDYKNNALFGDPSQRWYTLGLKWNMSESAFLSFMYQISDVDFKNRAYGAMFGDPTGKYKGGLIGTQLSIKF